MIGKRKRKRKKETIIKQFFLKKILKGYLYFNFFINFDIYLYCKDDNNHNNNFI